MNRIKIANKMNKIAVTLAALHTHTHTHSQFIKENKKKKYIDREGIQAQQKYQVYMSFCRALFPPQGWAQRCPATVKNYLFPARTLDEFSEAREK